MNTPWKSKMITLVGKGVSPGLAKGKAFVYIDVLRRDSELYEIDPAQIGDEKARIEGNRRCPAALDYRWKHIEGKLGKKSADIFLACRAVSVMFRAMLQKSAW